MSRPAAEEQPSDPLAALSDDDKRLLEVVSVTLANHSATPGALMDRPLISIESDSVREVCSALKSSPDTAFSILLCMSAVDYKEYLQMVYILYSHQKNHTLVIKTDLPYENPSMPTVSDVWRAADWYERETHDLFGVHFEGHSDLSPLLLYDGFEGHPGLKEFPFHEYDEY